MCLSTISHLPTAAHSVVYYMVFLTKEEEEPSCHEEEEMCALSKQFLRFLTKTKKKPKWD